MVNVALDSGGLSTPSPTETLNLSTRQKEATILPLVQVATDCIARKVVSDPRYNDTIHPVEFNDLIVDSMQACAAQVRAMIEMHDRMFGSGSGDAFFLGPYLEVLPGAISKQVKAPQTDVKVVPEAPAVRSR